jgi:diguanylate cyclase (GGDEF)-like protein/PAS domain S-box-containing protein
MISSDFLNSNALGSASVPNLSSLLAVCVDRLNDGILITEAEPISNPGPRIVWANKVFYDRNGYRPDEVIGQTPRILQGPDTDRATLDKVRAALEKWQSIRAEIQNYRKDGTSYWNEMEIVPIANEKGWYTHWVSVQRDISERKAMQERLRLLAFYDTLTGLPNRRMLEDRLGQTLAASKRNKAYSALMFLDLDHFKEVNDAHGHAVGDLLLMEVARRLRIGLREADTVARLGGDEFVVVIGELGQDLTHASEQARILANKICVSLATPYQLTLLQPDKPDLTIQHVCSVSIGVVMFLNSTGSQIDIVKWGDLAMYKAKDVGGNAVRFYESNQLATNSDPIDTPGATSTV